MKEKPGELEFIKIKTSIYQNTPLKSRKPTIDRQKTFTTHILKVPSCKSIKQPNKKNRQKTLWEFVTYSYKFLLFC